MSSISSESRPRILLIGANGQVGWELAQTLSTLGDVTATTRTGFSLVVAECRPLDLTDANAIRACVNDVQPQLIVNAAAYTAVDRAESDTEMANWINADAVAVIAEAAKKIGAGVVHYSTDYVFNGAGDQPFCEDAPTGPLGAYGASKLAGEEALRSVGVDHLLLRVSWVYGVHGNNFVKTMLRLGLERPELSIVADQIGAPTSARAIAEATGQVLAQANGDFASFLNRVGGTYHFACDGTTSWHEFASEIFELANNADVPLSIRNVKAIPTADYPTPATRPLNSRLDCSKLTETFGIVGPSWQSALRATFANLRSTLPTATKADCKVA
ncbi:dTDP-4-dehydrorhamnose reductase [Thalassoroseus pseudoceratinae]|uniref:dTDP-4-dehydrorhamnose reductase n=1 Tax=Thalassoroseus pseudoceratinae TaxID=2713176 RepID=UPI00141DC1B3|nr:dTDP-4-dehydrorhamnose reductase [Thalassoroseus pseudoceratinae]